MASLVKKAILRTFFQLLDEKPLDKITVKDIVTRCDITRGGFYYHFRDIYAVLETFLDWELGKFAAADLSAEDWEDLFIQATSLLYAHKKIVSNIYNSSYREELMRYIDRAAGAALTRAIELASSGISATETDKKAIAGFYRCALRGVFGQWAASGMKQPLDKVIHQYGRLFRGNIVQALRRSAENAQAGDLPLE